MRRSRTTVFVIVFTALLGGAAFAQTTQGRLTGLVTDTQGAILPGATVTVTSPALIGVQSTVTQPDGRFLFPALPTGVYKVVVDLSGFQKLTREGVQIVLGQTISVEAVKARDGSLYGYMDKIKLPDGTSYELVNGAEAK